MGLTINKHYCHGKLAQVTLYVAAHCGCDGVDENSNCCREESTTLQLNEDYQLSECNAVPDALELHAPMFDSPPSKVRIVERMISFYPVKPPEPDIPIHKALSVYLI